MIRRERRDGGGAREMRKGGKRERIEKDTRERIEIERKEKETKGSRDDNLKRKWRNVTSYLCLLFSFLKALRTPMSFQLDSAVSAAVTVKY